MSIRSGNLLLTNLVLHLLHQQVITIVDVEKLCEQYASLIYSKEASELPEHHQI
jgi:hypothetical protein